MLESDPLQLSQVIILFKKLLFLSTANKFLITNHAKFYPEIGGNEDNFRAVTYVSYGTHWTRQENSYGPIKITFAHRIAFDDSFETANIRTNVQFSLPDPAATQASASLVHISSYL